MTGSAMSKAVASEDALDGGDGGYGADVELDEAVSNGLWTAWECVVVEGEPEHCDDLFDLGRSEGF
jgi:hypothetical protein